MNQFCPITLPDNSRVILCRSDLKFYYLPDRGSHTTEELIAGINDPETPPRFDVSALKASLEKPQHKFGKCFRRVHDATGYSFARRRQPFSLASLSNTYSFQGFYRGGMYSFALYEWHFLDGGIIDHMGYGWGGHTWTMVVGAEALRVVCLCFGIEQPLRIKGEGIRRPLGLLLQEMSHVPLNEEKYRCNRIPSLTEKSIFQKISRYNRGPEA